MKERKFLLSTICFSKLGVFCHIKFSSSDEEDALFLSVYVVATVAGAVYGVTGVSHEILNLAIVALILD